MRRLVLGAMALCAALMAATLAGPAFGGTSGRSTAAASPPKTSGFGALGPITLNVWSYDNQKPGLQDVIEKMTKNFEKKYPNVTIKLKFLDFNSLVNTVNRALASDSGPDITEGNQGYQTDALEVKAKLILPLDPYVKAYGWDKWQKPSTWQIFQWTPDGRTFGKGPKWGVAQTGQNVILYVNTKKLAAAGIKLSSLTTFKAFDQAVTTLRKKLPKSDPVIEFGNKEGYGTIHFLGGLQGAYGGAKVIRDWIYHVPGSTWETPQNTKALQKLADWAKAGVFNPDYNAVGYDNAAALFAKGKGVFLYEGNWQTAVVDAGLHKDVSIINMPPGPSGKHVGIGATSGPWHISAKTKYPDVAAAWLNYIIGSPEAKASMFSYAQIPAVAGAVAPPGNRLLGQATKAFQQVGKDDGLMLYTDWASTSMYDTLSKNFQLVMGGKESPADAAKAIQSDWAKFDTTLK
ncbi:MAG: raffinose/stachyose/melibiose transport system substrate-binding protein [Gaiellales bacterium]|nr:raffinose/stachyose/melibiose transport system substrate-binding protein [Gaiellales bacterium]